MMEKLEEAVMLTPVSLFEPFQDSQRKSTSHSRVPGRGNRAKLVTPSEYRRQHLNSETCSSSSSSKYDKYESSTSGEYNNNELSSSSSSSSTFISVCNIYDEINFPDIPPLFPQYESTGPSHLHYNETQAGSKTSRKGTPLYKEQSNNNHQRDIVILPNIPLKIASKRISDENTLKENQPIKTSLNNNNKPNTHKRNNILEKIDKKEGKQNYGAKQSDLSLLDDSSDDETVRQYKERQKSKHRPGGARLRRRERSITFYDRNQAMCYDVTSNTRRDEAEPVSLPALDNSAGVPDMSRESRKKDRGFGQMKLPAIPKKQLVTQQRGDLKRSKDDRVLQNYKHPSSSSPLYSNGLNTLPSSSSPEGDKLESLTVYQLLKAIPGVIAKANTKKVTPKQRITIQLPKLDVKKMSMLDRKLFQDSEEKTNKDVTKRRTNK